LKFQVEVGVKRGFEGKIQFFRSFGLQFIDFCSED
jgi:hypothetical protein